MNKKTNWFKGVQSSLIWMLGVAVLIVIAFIIIQELFCVGTLLDNVLTVFLTLGLSYISSFIFYFIQVHLKEINDRNRILPAVECLFSRLLHYVNNIVVDTICFCDPQKKDIQINEISKSDYLSSAVKIRFDFGSSVYQGDTELSWLQYYTFRQKQIDEYRHIIMEYSPYLGERCISLLAELRNDFILYSLVQSANDCKEVGLDSNFNLSGVECYCGFFFDLVTNLNKYYKDELEEHKSPINVMPNTIYKGKHKQIVL